MDAKLFLLFITLTEIDATRGGGDGGGDGDGDALMKALIRCDYDEARRLLKALKMDFSARDHYGNTILHLAARRGPADIVSFLLKNGGKAVLEVKNFYAYTALKVAVTWRNPDSRVAESLVEAGAEIETLDKNSETCVHAAVVNDSEVLEYLIRQGGKIDSKNRTGQTPLSLAASHNRILGARVLVKHGAKIQEIPSQIRDAFVFRMQQDKIDQVMFDFGLYY